MKTRKEFLRDAKGKMIICYGAGKYFPNVIGFLEAERLSCSLLVDSSCEKWGTCVGGLKVYSPEEIKKHIHNKVIVLISSKNYSREIEDRIRKEYPWIRLIYHWPLAFGCDDCDGERLWYERMYKPCEYLYREIAEDREDKSEYLLDRLNILKNQNSLILPRTPLMITTRCSLRCKECSNLIPYYENPKDYPADSIIQWIDNVSSAVDDWVVLEFVGGEPFLYRDLLRILVPALNNPKIQRVEFTTNGSVLPEKGILELLRDKKIVVKISEYGTLIKTDKLIDAFRINGIKFQIMHNLRWSKTGDLISRGRDRKSLVFQYLNCGPAKICRTILNGKLYACSKAASLSELGLVGNMEFVDVTVSENLRDRIRAFLEMDCINACDYCDMGTSDEEVIEPAEQIVEKTEEYLIRRDI